MQEIVSLAIPFHNGELYIVTAAHLLRNGWEGRVYYQPNQSFTGEENRIGEVYNWVDIYKDAPDSVAPDRKI